MTIAVADYFPLQYTLDQAESVRRFLDGRPPERLAPTLDAVIRAAIQVGEQLPDAWRRTCQILAAEGEGWMTLEQYEEERNAIRQLFLTVREAMDGARCAADKHLAATGHAPADLPRLLTLTDEVRRLEREALADGPSFAESPRNST